MSSNRLPNPFTPTKPVPPKRFIARIYEISAACSLIDSRGHVAIWGGPGMGKRSLLEKLADPQTLQEYGINPSQAVIVLLSCESITPFTPDGFWREVLNETQNHLDSEPQLQNEIQTMLENGQTNRHSLRQILKKLNQQDKFLLLLVDDFDTALNLREDEKYTKADMINFLSECRSLAVHDTRNLSMIVTSRKRLYELVPDVNPAASPWYNHYLFLHLKLFSEQEVDELLKPLTPHLTPELRAGISRITGGHPALLQLAGFHLYNFFNNSGNSKTSSVDEFNQFFFKEFESNTRNIFEIIWSNCNEVEQTLLMLIALSISSGRLHKRKNFDLSGIDLIFTQHERELSNLEEQGIIIHKTNIENKRSPNIYTFTSTIMERFVIQEIWNTENTNIQNRQRVFLRLMSHEQVNKVTELVQWLGKHQKDIFSVLETSVKLLGN
ncbi:ATP-binding protein [Nostoc sp. FACHB-110]|uniref:AAA family ATPase n=1 Tax=Nostoc sp. FACHB-110 TaxID=2692834 RepID=UPI001681ECB6|nr:ATP-binding protein [Nostoc sp. FACHB-110]MBD2438988.1 ATP-binding protein [Nostoc sp. FACHB-110]